MRFIVTASFRSHGWNGWKYSFAPFSTVLKHQIRPFTTKPLESWEEVELNRPKVPTLEGYTRPEKAPDPSNIPRGEFHEFMRGKPQRFSKELKVVLTGWFFILWFFGLNWLTIKLMRPDDFGWVEEERKKFEDVKQRLSKFTEQKG